MNNVDKINTTRLLNNSINIYENYLLKNICNLEKDVHLTRDDIVNAALSMIVLNMVILKEEIIENNGNLNYSSKIFESTLNSCFDYIAIKDNDKYILGPIKDSAPSLFAVIRNKLAHGDFYIENDYVILNKIEGEIKINIISLLDFFIELNKLLFLNKKSDTFKRQIIFTKEYKDIKKIFDSDLYLNTYIGLNTLTEIQLIKKDGTLIDPEIKDQFNQLVYHICGSIEDTKEIKRLFEPIKNKLYSYGYIVDIKNKKIKDKNIVNKLKEYMETDADFAKSLEVGLLNEYYSEVMNKILCDDQIERSNIVYTSILNAIILKEMLFVKDINNFDEIIKRLRLQIIVQDIYFYAKELLTSTILAKFVSLYSYNLDDIFKNDNNYHLEREELFDFSKLDLSEINPSKIEINMNGINNINNEIDRTIKTKMDIKEKIIRLNSYIEGLNKKKDKTEREINKITDFINEINKLNNKTAEIDKIIQDLLIYKSKVESDYLNNSKYFENMAIIEGIRNSIAHGNVIVIPDYKSNNIYDTKVRFKNIYKGEVVFDLTTSIYNFEDLFNDYNISIISDYLTKTKKK